MRDFNVYRQRVIAQRDILQKLYRERHITRRIIDTLSRLPLDADTRRAHFRFLGLEARLNESIRYEELIERRLSLIGSVTRFATGTTGGNDRPNSEDGGNGGENNTSSDRTENVNNTSSNRTGYENINSINKITSIIFFLCLAIFTIGISFLLFFYCGPILLS